MPTCVEVDLDDGRTVCLLSASPVLLAGPTSGVSVEALTAFDPSAPLEPSVDLRPRFLDGCLQVRDQGRCGWCVDHSIASALDALYCANGCPPALASIPHLREEAEGAVREDSCSHGLFVTDGLTAAISSWLVNERVWPYAASSRAMRSTRPSSAALASGPRYHASGWESVPPTHDAAQLDTMKRVLASGRVLMVSSGVCWRQGWSNGTAVIDVPTGTCGRGPGYDGYHQYVLLGYDDRRREFIGLNSYGESWGDRGYGRFTYEYVRRELDGIYYFDDMMRRTWDDGDACPMPDTAPADLEGRCAAIDDCGSCASTLGCLYCDGRCTAAAANGTSPATGTCTSAVASAEACPVPVSQSCSPAGDCDSCTRRDGCMWCGARCVAWPEDRAACSGRRAAADPPQCAAAVGLCARASDCSTCVAEPGCGWCVGVGCVGGESVPDDTECAEEAWTPSGGTCEGTPPPAPECGALDCLTCMTTSGCSYCPSSSECMASSEASTCDGGTTLDVGACGQCRDRRGTCADRWGCCGAATTPTVQCIDNFCEDTSMCVQSRSRCLLDGADCCGGSMCGLALDGSQRCCTAAGGTCREHADCCGNESCIGGVCRAQAVGAPCLQTQECEGASYCLEEGVCGF